MRFAIVGGGWRSEFYLRICRELPDQFEVTGVLVRDATKAMRFSEQWGVRTVSDLDALLGDKPAFVVTSLPWRVNPSLLQELSERGVPVLSETPPAPDLEGLIDLHHRLPAGARVQVAEQYAFQPLNAATIALARSGRLGNVTQAQVSVAHGYHGISLIRRVLGIDFEDAEIHGIQFNSPIVSGPDRTGPPRTESLAESSQEIATLSFPGKLAIFDFTGNQYFSWIRGRRMLVRGERGEIENLNVRYLADFQTPITESLTRVDAGQDGNLEGYYHKGILCGSEWAYRNPFVPARLADDEIAIATCLKKMGEYVEGGDPFYSLAEASQDHYLSMQMRSVIESQSRVKTSRQPWARS